MVKTTNNEQGFNILAHHQKWVVKDMDGLQVINHPLEDEPAAWRDKTGWSKNAKRLRHKRYTKGYAIKENDSDNRSESH